MNKKDYHLGQKHAYEVFLLVEEIIDQGHFPIMSSFMNEELSLWEQVIKDSHNPSGTFLEIGCGGGRAIDRLKKFGITVAGIDINPYLIQHCQDRGLDAQEINIFDPIPPEIQGKADFAGIGFNTLFNFEPEDRKKWIEFGYQALKLGGKLMISFYSDNKYVDQYSAERIRWYDVTNKPPVGFVHSFYNENNERGIRLTAPDGSIPWQSAWKKKETVLAEAKTWTGFKVEDIILFPCKIGNLLVLEKI